METKVTVKINTQQELYVIPAGSGCSCLGFDVCLQRGKALSQELGKVAFPYQEERGTLEAYYRLCFLENVVYEKFLATGFRSETGLHPQLKGYEGWRVEVTDQEDRTYRFNVGKSTGWIPCHLQIHNKRSHGGSAVDSRNFKRVVLIRRVRG